MGNAQTSASAATSILNEASSSLTTASGLVCGSIADALDDKPSLSSSKRKNHSNNSDDSNNRSTSPMLILPSEFCNSNGDTLSPTVSKQQLSHKKQQSSNNNNNNKSDANDNNDNDDGSNKINPTSALFARALISEVTDNPHTMSPEAMAAREKRLLQAQNKDRKSNMTKIMDTLKYHLEGVGVTSSNTTNTPSTPTANNNPPSSTTNSSSRSMSYPPNQLSENRAQLGTSSSAASTFPSPDYDAPLRPGTHTITIGLSLSRRHSTVGHPDTVTRQTAFDFNELQDRNYKYVSSTDASGWRAGGGEKGGQQSSLSSTMAPLPLPLMSGDDHQSQHKIASPDTVHIPILQIDADSPAVVDQIIGALARGELFIPHMSVLPEALSVNGVSPPDLIVRFGCERNDDLPPEEWPNWTLEFMHNQLYDYFSNLGARWMKRPFQITLAKKVRWRTVKHMNKFFAHSERVISAWREKGPQYLNPQLSYIEGGATPEEVARPHGIYLLRDGRPTNYFAPNFEPPYTTKMTRSLILNVLDKSWDKKRRDWNSLPPVPRIVPGLLLGAVCGCEMRGVDSPQAISTSTKDNSVRLGMTEAVTQREGSGGIVNPAPDSNSTGTSRNNSSPHNKKSSSQSNNNGTSSSSRSSPRGSPVQAEQQLSSKHTDRSSHQQQQQQQPPLSESTSDTNNENKNHRANNTNSSEIKGKLSKDDKKKKKKKQSKHHQIDTSSSSTPPKSNDPATMDMSSSIGESHTTIPISNASPRLLEREREKRKQRELEMRKEREKMEKIEEAIRKRKEGQVTTTTTKEETEQSGSDSKAGRKKEKKSRQKSSKQQQQQQRRSPPSSNYVSPVSHCTDDQSHFTFESATSAQNNSNKHHNHHRVNSNGSIPLIRSHSQNSLEYSVDDSLSIGRFRSDASVATNNTANQSLLSYVTRSTIHDDRSSSDYHHHQHHSKTTTTTTTATTSSRKDFLLGDDDDDEDDFKNDDVPSDEELFAIGWAKALDANSGSYYYFTLDRSKIVWENPLAGDVPHLMGSSGSSSVGLRT